MSEKRTIVLGASTNPNRYSHLAVQKLITNGHPVIAIGKQPGKIGDIEIFTEPVWAEKIHTITLYINPENQKIHYNYILSVRPERLIFNPGTENKELESMAQESGINTLNACTLVMLHTGQY